MGEVIKVFGDGSVLEYDTGNFDEWCVYLTRPTERRKPPRDTEYFSVLQKLADKYKTEKVFGDYIKVYNMTEKSVNRADLEKISGIAKGYGQDSVLVDIIFTILYMAMIAEERKRFTRLGKRIKRLGIYKLLIEGKSVGESANFMRGLKWYEIDAICKERGF